MEIISSKTDFYIRGKTSVAIGKFDGIHRGHLELLSHVLRQKKQGRKAAIFTFYPSANVFFGKEDTRELTTRDEKRMLFEQMGIDVLVEFPLNEETAGILPEAFIKEILVDHMNVAYVCAGSDVSFGKGGKGNQELLCRMGEECGFRVEVIRKVYDKERAISSTYVREEIEQGHMKKASQLLGRPYFFYGTVENGKHLGRTFGVPTVNLYPEKGKLLPPRGVYVSRVHIGSECFYGMTNIGCKPTVQQEERISVETYLYDFEKEIYGQPICVELLAYQREEKKFSNVSDLQCQLHKDLEDGRCYLKSHPEMI